MYGGGGAGCGCCWWLLVVEDDVWPPNLLEGKADIPDVTKVGVVPGEVGVVPLLASSHLMTSSLT